MYKGIKTALGSIESKTTLLKINGGEVIIDKVKQMEKWVEHYSELYSRETVVITPAIDPIEPLPIMEELDTEPSLGSSVRLLTV